MCSLPIYDYDAFVIVANCEDEARELAINEANHQPSQPWEQADIEELGEYIGSHQNPFVLLGSYNAG